MPCMDGHVWVSDYQVQSFGDHFAIGQHVTWPLSRELNVAALTERVGAGVAARVWMAVDWHARQPGDTAAHAGTVTRTEGYGCRHVQGRVRPGTLETRLLVRSTDWGSADEKGVDVVGYLVTLTGVRPAVER